MERVADSGIGIISFPLKYAEEFSACAIPLCIDILFQISLTTHLIFLLKYCSTFSHTVPSNAKFCIIILHLGADVVQQVKQPSVLFFIYSSPLVLMSIYQQIQTKHGEAERLKQPFPWGSH